MVTVGFTGAALGSSAGAQEVLAEASIATAAWASRPRLFCQSQIVMPTTTNPTPTKVPTALIIVQQSGAAAPVVVIVVVIIVSVAANVVIIIVADDMIVIVVVVVVVLTPIRARGRGEGVRVILSPSSSSSSCLSIGQEIIFGATLPLHSGHHCRPLWFL